MSDNRITWFSKRPEQTGAAPDGELRLDLLDVRACPIWVGSGHCIQIFARVELDAGEPAPTKGVEVVASGDDAAAAKSVDVEAAAKSDDGSAPTSEEGAPAKSIPEKSPSSSSLMSRALPGDLLHSLQSKAKATSSSLASRYSETSTALNKLLERKNSKRGFALAAARRASKNHTTSVWTLDLEHDEVRTLWINDVTHLRDASGFARSSSSTPSHLHSSSSPPATPDAASAAARHTAQLEKRARMRRNVVNEMVCSERSYVHDLTTLVSVFVKPDGNGKNPLTAADHKTLFSSVEQIVFLNARLLKDLERATEGAEIGRIMLDFAPYFSMSVIFCSPLAKRKRG